VLKQRDFGRASVGRITDESSWRVLAAVSIRLIIGKPIGVLAASWLTLRLGIGTPPAGLLFAT
jgi:NhaA family Na+:H+ antiporter